MNDRPVPPSLLVPTLGTFWSTVRRRVERGHDPGTPITGRVSIGRLGNDAQLALEGLLGRRLGTSVDLAALEAAFARIGVATSLPDALTRLGHPPSPVPAARRAARLATAAAHAAARATAALWDEPWAGEWIDAVVRSGGLRGLDADGASRLVQDVRTVVAALDERGAEGVPRRQRSRTDLAAALFGDAHALDTGTRREAAVTRALALRHENDDRRELWGLAGVHLDLTSAPVLVWNLPLLADDGVAPLVRAATERGLPLHLSQLALREHPLRVAPGTVVLIVENPRIVEAAAQRRSAAALACAAGNPSVAVQLFLAQLLACHANVRYHGDFDAAGLAIAARLHERGAVPWRMGVADYRTALAAADDAGVELPRDERPAPPTPWEPELRTVFDLDRRIVHEERLLEELLE